MASRKEEVMNVLEIGKTPVYRLEDFLMEIKEEFEIKRYYHVPLVVFFVEAGLALEFKNMSELEEAIVEAMHDEYTYEVRLVHEGYRYNKEREASENFVSAVLVSTY